MKRRMRIDDIRQRVTRTGDRLKQMVNLWMVEILFDNGSRMLSHNLGLHDAIHLQEQAAHTGPIVFTMAAVGDETLTLPVMSVVSATRINLVTGEAIARTPEPLVEVELVIGTVWN